MIAKIYFDDSCLPALRRLFDILDLEIIESRIGNLEPWYEVKRKKSATVAPLADAPGVWISPNKGEDVNAVKLDIDTEGRLVATESVLEMCLEEYDFIGYDNADGDIPPTKTVYLDRHTYDELGRPSVITARILPGDKLNRDA